MKLRTISEAPVDPDAALNLMGTAAKQMFGKNKELPDRLRQHNQEDAEYQRAKDDKVKCETCKYYDENKHGCAVVEGKIHPMGVCKFWAEEKATDVLEKSPGPETGTP